MKWVNFPTITTILQTNYPISKIPFPAVTICSNNRVYDNKLVQLADDDNGPLKGAHKKLNSEDEETRDCNLYCTLSDVLRRYIYFWEEKYIEKDIQRPERINQYHMIQNYYSKIPDILESVMLPCEEMIFICQLEGRLERCGDLFRVSKSDSGFCCSFNYIRTENTTKTSGGETDNRLSYDEKDLRKTNGDISMLGLTVLLHGNRKEYKKGYVHNLANDHFYGFRVLIHDPYTFPEVGGKGIALGVGQEAFIPVSAKTVQSSDNVKAMTFEKRQCIYFDEDLAAIPESYRPELFKQYTMTECLYESRAKQIMKECGCLPYYYPDYKIVWKQETSCNVTGIQCLANKYVELRIKETKDESVGSKCPEDCDKTTYYPEISQVPLIPRRALHWITVRTGHLSDDEALGIIGTINKLERNGWSGLDENKNPIIWNENTLIDLEKSSYLKSILFSVSGPAR